jgi:diacylglycerol O-acyltransferase
MFNITISNVPGPETPLYFRGAELLAIYPASIVTHGQALNITCESYAGFMNFGFTACHTSVPSIQRLAVYAAEAMDELEDAVLPRTPARLPAPKASTPVAAAKPPAAARKRGATATSAPTAVKKRAARAAAPDAAPAAAPRRARSRAVAGSSGG